MIENICLKIILVLFVFFSLIQCNSATDDDANSGSGFGATTTSSTSDVVPNHLTAVDLFIICLYLVITLAVGLYVLCKTDRSNVSGFFLAGQNVTWLPIGASLFSSNITSGSFVGLAGAGAASGIAVGAYEWNAILALIALGWVFAPKYLASGVATLPQYMKVRFGGNRIQVYLSVLSLLLYIFVKISSDLYSGAIFMKLAGGWNISLSVILILIITAVYTVTGGLKAVMYTDTFQTFFMFIGSFVMMVIAFLQVGGYEKLTEKYMEAIPVSQPPNSTCGLPRKDSFHMFHHASSDDMPWPGMLIGLTIIDVWYWCTDQVIAQRTLAAKSIYHAKGACIFAGLLKILPVFMMVMVGMISRVMYPDFVACATPEACLKQCGASAGCSNYAYPKLVVEILPTGLRGLLLASILAALMSTLSSVFNSASALFACDIWCKFRKSASEWEIMVVGRLFIVAMVTIAFFWVPVIQSSSSQLFDYMQSITCYFTPPITVVFVMSVFWKDMNEKGAFWSLMVGFLAGFIRMIMDFVYGAPSCGEEEYRPAILYKIHYLHFAILLAALTCIVAVIVTLTSPRKKSTNKSDEQTKALGEELERVLEKRDSSPREKEEVLDQHEKRSRCLEYLCLYCGLDDQKKNVKVSIHSKKLPEKEQKTVKVVTNLLAAVNVMIVIALFAKFG